ncbi:MAG: siderophore-interacting protein [Actinomycetota bacterium]
MQIDGFNTATSDELAATLPGLFDQYASTLAFIARPTLGIVDGEVVVSRLSPNHMVIGIGTQSATVEFDEPIVGLEDLVGTAVSLAEVARDQFPDAPLTELEQVMSSVRSQQLYQGTVVDTHRLSDSVYSVRIGPFPRFASLGWDQSVSVFTGSDGRDIPPDMTFEQWRDMPMEEAPRARTYTIRSIDDAGVLDLWVALHGDDPVSVSTWAQRCVPGDPVSVMGPRGRFEHRSDAARAVLIADETALGAAAAVADHLDVPAEIIGVVSGASDEVDFALTSCDVTWLHEPVDSDRRAAAVRARLVVDDDTLYWGAGEFSMIGTLRRTLRREFEIPSSHVALTAYWRADL